MESWSGVGQGEASRRQVTLQVAPESVTPETAAPEPNAPVPLVREVSALWSRYLDSREVGADDDFFTLGGNSLIGIKIIDQIHQDYGVELSVRAFYLAQTPARVAQLIEQGRVRP